VRRGRQGALAGGTERRAGRVAAPTARQPAERCPPFPRGPRASLVAFDIRLSPGEELAPEADVEAAAPHDLRRQRGAGHEPAAREGRSERLEVGSIALAGAAVGEVPTSTAPSSRSSARVRRSGSGSRLPRASPRSSSSRSSPAVAPTRVREAGRRAPPLALERQPPEGPARAHGMAAFASRCRRGSSGRGREGRAHLADRRALRRRSRSRQAPVESPARAETRPALAGGDGGFPSETGHDAVASSRRSVRLRASRRRPSVSASSSAASYSSR
jgi:hypothetical protein